MSKYIEIIDLGIRVGKKTKLFQVWNTQHSELLGEIKWYGGWRKYVFYPVNIAGEQIWYDAACLQMIGDFCEVATKEHLK